MRFNFELCGESKAEDIILRLQHFFAESLINGSQWKNLNTAVLLFFEHRRFYQNLRKIDTFFAHWESMKARQFA